MHPCRPTMTSSPSSTSLSTRQREVLIALCQGCSNRDIARRLDISEKTVKAHVSAIFDALRVTNRTQASAVAHRLGLYPPRAPD